MKTKNEKIRPNDRFLMARYIFWIVLVYAAFGAMILFVRNF